MLQTETASDQLLRNFLDLPPAAHVFLAQLLRCLVHLVSGGVFLVPPDPFQSFQLRTYLRDLTSHCMPSSCVFSTCSHLVRKSSTFLRVLPIHSNLFWSEGKSLSVPRNECTRVELNQNRVTAFPLHTQKIAQTVQPIKICCLRNFGFQRLLCSGEHVFKN